MELSLSRVAARPRLIEACGWVVCLCYGITRGDSNNYCSTASMLASFPCSTPTTSPWPYSLVVGGCMDERSAPPSSSTPSGTLRHVMRAIEHYRKCVFRRLAAVFSKQDFSSSPLTASKNSPPPAAAKARRFSVFAFPPKARVFTCSSEVRSKISSYKARIASRPGAGLRPMHGEAKEDAASRRLQQGRRR